MSGMRSRAGGIRFPAPSSSFRQGRLPSADEQRRRDDAGRAEQIEKLTKIMVKHGSQSVTGHKALEEITRLNEEAERKDPSYFRRGVNGGALPVDVGRRLGSHELFASKIPL